MHSTEPTSPQAGHVGLPKAAGLVTASPTLPAAILRLLGADAGKGLSFDPYDLPSADAGAAPAAGPVEPKVEIDHSEAENFLSFLDPGETRFTFQTFDDDKVRVKANRAKAGGKGKDPFARIFHGTLDEHFDELKRRNDAGAGVFVTVNVTDGKGRENANIVRPRAPFVDLDGSPLDPVLNDPMKPHIIVESSPKRYHAYWLVNGLELKDFTPAQKVLAARFKGDPKVHDLPRVMRLPGFVHRKGVPFLTTMISSSNDAPYAADEFLAKLAELPKQAAPEQEQAHDQQDSKPKPDPWREINSKALKNLTWVLKIFPNAVPSGGGYRVSSAMLGRDLIEDLSFSPKGIKDFGVHDLGDPREGARTAVEIVVEYLPSVNKDEIVAADWLREQLGLRTVALKDFHAYLPQHVYIYGPTREMWPEASIKGTLGKNASRWLDQHRAVHQATWAPGLPEVIKDRLVADGGWINHDGVTVLNLYRPPTIKHGDASKAGPWIEHVKKVYPDDADHIIKWCAHRVQRPEEKINHSLLLGGNQGIGKDTLLEPVKRAVGPWNFKEVTPKQIIESRFNGYLQSVILRVSESRDLGDSNRYDFYDHMKGYTAAPPDVLRCDEKYIREHAIFNVCGVIYTTNYKTNGLYLPADDRRTYVAWSDLDRERDFDASYWPALWGWINDGGDRHVAAYLATLDISAFDPKAPPPKTPAFWEIVDANRAPEDAELADVLDHLKNPPVVTLVLLLAHASTALKGWLEDRKNRRVIPHRLETVGYVPIRNADAKDGLWKIEGARQVIYARTDLSVSERLRAAQEATTGKFPF